METHLRVGVGVGCLAHRVGCAEPGGSILEEPDISQSEAGFEASYRRIEKQRQDLALLVAVAMEGCDGRGRAADCRDAHPYAPGRREVGRNGSMWLRGRDP